MQVILIVRLGGQDKHMAAHDTQATVAHDRASASEGLIAHVSVLGC